MPNGLCFVVLILNFTPISFRRVFAWRVESVLLTLLKTIPGVDLEVLGQNPLQRNQSQSYRGRFSG